MNYADTLINARRYEEMMNESAVPAIAGEIGKRAARGAFHTAKTYAKAAAPYAKAYGKYMGATALGAVGAMGVANTMDKARDAARTIAGKKKAAKDQGTVKENYEFEEYKDLVECIINNLDSEELMMENSGEFACEVADYIIDEEVNMKEKVANAANKIKNGVVNVAKGAKAKAGAAVKSARDEMNAYNDYKRNTSFSDRTRNNLIGAYGGGDMAVYASKRIADKKKAAAAAGAAVKENYEFEEYKDLVESVINDFMSEAEIMSENASEIAIATADYMIENADMF